MTVLSIKGLSVAFATPDGDLRALRDVDLAVPERRIVGVVGESGCGKSTLVNAILGLLPANGRIDGGSILFEGGEISALGPAEQRDLRGLRISTVFQDPMGALNPVLAVGRQMRDIQYRSRLSRADKDARSAAMLRRTGIPDPESALTRHPHEFSGGMKQRIAIAMALMMEPALLIADEPTTALDATLEMATLGLLRDLQEQAGCSVIFISHHLGAVAELCHDVVVMYAGEVVERGDARRVFSNARHPYTARLLECDPARRAERTRNLPTIPGELPDLRRLPGGCVFAPRCERRHDACASPPPEIVAAEGHVARCVLAGSR